MAGERHGMCELTRHGMAGNGIGTAKARHGFCELAFIGLEAFAATEFNQMFSGGDI
jgi:hypothetical protein